jgi:hypothetical protein
MTSVHRLSFTVHRPPFSFHAPAFNLLLVSFVNLYAWP